MTDQTHTTYTIENYDGDSLVSSEMWGYAETVETVREAQVVGYRSGGSASFSKVHEIREPRRVRTHEVWNVVYVDARTGECTTYREEHWPNIDGPMYDRLARQVELANTRRSMYDTTTKTILVVG